MSKKQITFKTRGMNRDLSVSAFNPDFAFENINLRLQTNENNTLMSWVNEKGTQLIGKRVTTYTDYWTKEGEEPVYEDPEDATWEHHRRVDLSTEALSLSGIVIGNAVLNHQLVLFTTEKGNGILKPDHIYVCTYSNAEKTDMTVRELYHGRLNFNVLYPLETHVSYESGHVQKVYWTDGLNQPRVINIAADDAHVDMWNTRQAIGTDTWFDFIPSTGGVRNVSVQNSPGSGGTFAPGVIQYCITYFNKYGQQSNVVWVTPLYYLAHTDRGGSPEGKVSNVLTITITGIDTTFDYIRLYSVQRTSIDAVPFVKVLEDLKITGTGPIVFTDNGTVGYTVDPTELLYAGGKEISCLTMTSKDDTLFMGNIVEQHVDVQKIQDYFTKHTPALQFTTTDSPKQIPLPDITGFYSYKNTLDESEKAITTFKGGEHYRLGFQLQKVTGEWTEPIFLDNVDNNAYPTVSGDNILLPFATNPNPISFSDFTDPANAAYIPNFSATYKKIRSVIAYPDIAHRKVLCQGVLNPTVFNVEDRATNSPFAQASWYFRPYSAVDVTNPEKRGDIYLYTLYSVSDDSKYADVRAMMTGETQVFDGISYDEVSVLQYNTENEGDPVASSYYIDSAANSNTTHYPLYDSTGTATGLYAMIYKQEPNTASDAVDISYIASTDEGASNYVNLVNYFENRNLYIAANALLVLIPNSNSDKDRVPSILARGKISAEKEGSSSGTEEEGQTSEDGKTIIVCNFAAIKADVLKGLHNFVGDIEMYDCYILIRTDLDSNGEAYKNWPNPKEYEYHYLNDIYVIGWGATALGGVFTAHQSHLCTCLKQNTNHILYYETPTWTPNPTNSSASESTDPVPFYCTNQFFLTIFSDTDDAKYGVSVKFDSLGSTVVHDYDGNSLSYGHYSSIYAQSDLPSNADPNDARQIEIHGSKNVYSSVTDTKSNNLESNTQFFIDHSIVTLNSPDIDFDPALQGYGTEGLGLRVVGVIPITSNASYHKITTGSAMLESWHHYNNEQHGFGYGESDFYTLHVSGDKYVGSRLVADYLWNDVEVEENYTEDDHANSLGIFNYLVYTIVFFIKLPTTLFTGEIVTNAFGSYCLIMLTTFSTSYVETTQYNSLCCS